MGDTSHFNGSLNDSAAVELTGKIMVAAIIVLFLVVVFVLFLHLYAKWFWWRVEDPTHPSNHSRRRGRRFVFAPGQQEASAAALRQGLEPSVLRSLPVLVFKPEEYKDGLECAVCLSELVEGEKARMLPNCNHGFHVECIDMWFQSHSTCPLCRNSVGPDSTSNSSSSFEFPDTASPTSTISSQDDDNNSGVVGVGVIGYSLESPNFPTNVLFWGNQTQVSSGVLCLDEGPSSQPPPSSSSSSTTTTTTSTSTSSSSSNRPDGMLVIDIPRQTAENFSSCSPSGRYTPDEDQKSPLPTRLRSLKRLLSREKRVIPCSPNSVDVEQGVGSTTSR